MKMIIKIKGKIDRVYFWEDDSNSLKNNNDIN